jgi:hypothetical protein
MASGRGGASGCCAAHTAELTSAGKKRPGVSMLPSLGSKYSTSWLPLASMGGSLVWW